MTADGVASAIIAEGLSKSYGEREVLRDVTFSAEAGSCLGIFGANGSGKTTLLKLISTLLLPTRGVLEVCGHSVPGSAREARQKLSTVFDAPPIPDDFTLAEGLHYHADLRGHAHDADRLHSIAERVGLGWRMRDPLRTFSRGMAQRASLACALLEETPVLILDEPFTALDQRGCEFVETVVQERRQAGACILLVTHEWDRGARLADSVIALKQGCVILQAGPGEWSREDLERC